MVASAGLGCLGCSVCSGGNNSLWLSLGGVGREPHASFPSHLHSDRNLRQAGGRPDLWVQHSAGEGVDTRRRVSTRQVALALWKQQQFLSVVSRRQRLRDRQWKSTGSQNQKSRSGKGSCPSCRNTGALSSPPLLKFWVMERVG